MVRCERAALILFVNYLQRRIEKECRNVRDSVRCSMQVLEDVRVKLEEFAIEDIEREIFS